MKILAIDTSSPMASIAILNGEELLLEISQLLDRSHSANIIPIIQQSLKQVGMTLQEFDGYAVGIGPGSFTGIRVGIATIKGLAYATRKPVVGVSSLCALAYNGSNTCDSVAVLVDAKKNLVYFAWYRPRQRGGLFEVIPPSLVSLKEALAKITRTTLFLGDIIQQYKSQIKRAKKKLARFAETTDHFPRAVWVGRLALEKFRQGKSQNLESLTPQYLYSRYCSIKGIER